MHTHLYDAEFQKYNVSDLPLSISNFLKKIITSKQKQLLKVSLCSFVAWLVLVTQPKFYADTVNNWLVIQDFSDPCKSQVYGVTLL